MLLLVCFRLYLVIVLSGLICHTFNIESFSSGLVAVEVKANGPEHQLLKSYRTDLHLDDLLRSYAYISLLNDRTREFAAKNLPRVSAFIEVLSNKYELEYSGAIDPYNYENSRSAVGKRFLEVVVEGYKVLRDSKLVGQASANQLEGSAIGNLVDSFINPDSEHKLSNELVKEASHEMYDLSKVELSDGKQQNSLEAIEKQAKFYGQLAVRIFRTVLALGPLWRRDLGGLAKARDEFIGYLNEVGYGVEGGRICIRLDQGEVRDS